MYFQRDLADLRSTCCGERVTAEEVPTLVHQELGKVGAGWGDQVVVGR